MHTDMLAHTHTHVFEVGRRHGGRGAAAPLTQVAGEIAADEGVEDGDGEAPLCVVSDDKERALGRGVSQVRRRWTGAELRRRTRATKNINKVQQTADPHKRTRWEVVVPLVAQQRSDSLLLTHCCYLPATTPSPEPAISPPPPNNQATNWHESLTSCVL